MPSMRRAGFDAPGLHRSVPSSAAVYARLTLGSSSRVDSRTCVEICEVFVGKSFASTGSATALPRPL